MALIPLSRGLFATVDDADVEWLGQWKWCSHRAGRSVHAVRSRKGAPLIYMHREIMQARLGQFVDHVNCDPLDNRRANLRLCTPKENARNRRPNLSSGTPYKGVARFRTGFKAYIVADRHYRHLGCFKTAEEAAAAYDTAAIRLHGEFARLNGV